MRQAISGDIGFTVTGRIQIYETEPAEPPEKSRADTIFSLHLFAPTMTNRPNYAMERTATRCAFTSGVTTLCRLQSTLALGGRRSSWFR
jgi:hypothetical protein